MTPALPPETRLYARWEHLSPDSLRPRAGPREAGLASGLGRAWAAVRARAARPAPRKP